MRVVAAAILLLGCSSSSGSSSQQKACEVITTSPLCTNADGLADCSAPGAGCFKYIKQNIFDANCKSASCHELNGGGKLDISTGDSGTVTQAMAYAALVNQPSVVDPSYMLVVPGQPNQSYLLLMMQKVAPKDMDPPAKDPPSKIGYMPQNNDGNPVCCQKQDLVERWIAAGALNN